MDSLYVLVGRRYLLHEYIVGKVASDVENISTKERLRIALELCIPRLSSWHQISRTGCCRSWRLGSRRLRRTAIWTADAVETGTLLVAIATCASRVVCGFVLQRRKQQVVVVHESRCYATAKNAVKRAQFARQWVGRVVYVFTAEFRVSTSG